jgi:hypothetical protein
MDQLMFPLDLGEADAFYAEVGCTPQATPQAFDIGDKQGLDHPTSPFAKNAAESWGVDWSFNSTLFDETLFDFPSFDELFTIDHVLDRDCLGLANALSSPQSPTVTTVGGIPYYTPAHPSQEAEKTAESITQAANKRRTKITLEAKRRLLQEFRKNAYPSKEARAVIAVSVGLSETSIQHWFMNARQRLSSSQGTQQSDGISKEPCAAELPHVTTSNLDRLNRESPDPENAALDRFLANPSAEGPVAAAVISAVKSAPQQSPVPIQVPTPRRSHSVAGSAGSVARSIGSVRSIDSRGSRQGRLCWTTNSAVHNSLWSPSSLDRPGADSAWRSGLLTPESGFYGDIRYQNNDVKTSNLDNLLPSPYSFYPDWGFGRDSNMLPTPLTFQTPVISTEPPLVSSKASDNARKKDQLNTKAPKEDRPRRLFCTWPDCILRFRTHSEWERHEAPKHYRPYDWECCSLIKLDQPHFDCFVCDGKDITPTHIVREHFSACASKDALARTFYRKDQFVQHVKTHLPPQNYAGFTPVIPRSLLDYWAFDRADAEKDDPALICGFCGKRCSDWTERSHHVAEHMYRGTCKAVWWPERLPIVNADALRKLT